MTTYPHLHSRAKRGRRATWFVAAALALGLSSTLFAGVSTTPAKPSAETKLKWWLPRHEHVKALAAKGGYPVVFIGDSITHRWEKPGKTVWDAHFAEGDYRALNLGFSGDNTENVLWRIDNGELDGLDPKAVVLLIGTNNTGHRKLEEETPLDTLLGIQAIIDRVVAKCPKAKVILLPILPRGNPSSELRKRNDYVNRALSLAAKYAWSGKVLWCNFIPRLQAKDGTITREMFPDLLHPATAGYEIWAEELKPFLAYALGKGPKPPETRLAPPEPGIATVTPTISTRWLRFGAKEKRLAVKREEALAAKGKTLDLVMIGDSITHRWEKAGKPVWDRAFAGLSVLDLGFGGDTTQNLIFNIRHGGMLDGYTARYVTLLIGTNNIWSATPEEIAAGIKALLDLIREKQPGAKVVLMALLPRAQLKPRKGSEAALPKLPKINELIRPFADGENVIWLDLGDKMRKDGKPDISILTDGVHPNEAGYEIWAQALKEIMVVGS